MKIAIVGYGQMGKMIEKCIEDYSDLEAVTIDPVAKGVDYNKIDQESIKDCLVCIDFTRPDVILKNLELYAALGKNVVVGTTGWLDKLPEIEKLYKEAGIGLVHSSNFSIGVNLFFMMVKAAAKIINKFDEYDIFTTEWHHNKKVDSPSGTANSIASILLEEIERKDTQVNEMLKRKIEPQELHVASIRGGSIPGTHTVSFDSPQDTISLTHTARSREGFARGALTAARWIAGKKGVFTKEDMVEELLKR